MLWIPVVLGSIIVIYAVVQLIRYGHSNRWPTAVATVESVRPLRSQTGPGHIYRPVVSFSFAVEGERYSGEWTGPAVRTEQDVTDFAGKVTPPGATFNARYKPGQPSRNLLDVDPALYERDKLVQLDL